MTAGRERGGPAPSSERRRHPRLEALETGVVMVEGRLHRLVDWSPGGFLCAMPVGSAPAPGSRLDVRLIVSADGRTVCDFDVGAQLVRLNAEDGTIAARIDTLHGVAAARFEAFFDEVRDGRPPPADGDDLAGSR